MRVGVCAWCNAAAMWSTRAAQMCSTAAQLQLQSTNQQLHHQLNTSLGLCNMGNMGKPNASTDQPNITCTVEQSAGQLNQPTHSA
jgi:hypothetical protein